MRGACPGASLLSPPQTRPEPPDIKEIFWFPCETSWLKTEQIKEDVVKHKDRGQLCEPPSAFSFLSLRLCLRKPLIPS